MINILVRSQAGTLGAILLVLSLLAWAPSSANEMTNNTEYRHRIELQAGYFTGRRDMLRQLYGDAITFGARYQHRAFALRAGFSRLSQSDEAPSLLSVSLAPMVSFDLQRNQTLRFFTSVGAGVSRRAISWDLFVPQAAWSDVPPGYVLTRQTEWSFFGLVELGLDMSIGQQWSLGGRICYDYFPFGDPTIGSFGDTGGVYFLGSVGLGFGH